MLVFSGIGKLLAPAATIGYIKLTGLPSAAPELTNATTVELGGGLMLTRDFKTCIVRGRLQPLVTQLL